MSARAAVDALLAGGFVLLFAGLVAALVIALFGGREADAPPRTRLWKQLAQADLEDAMRRAERASGTVRVLDDDDPRIQAKRSDEEGGSPWNSPSGR